MSHFVGRCSMLLVAATAIAADRSLPVASGPIAGPYDPLETDETN